MKIKDGTSTALTTMYALKDDYVKSCMVTTNVLNGPYSFEERESQFAYSPSGSGVNSMVPIIPAYFPIDVIVSEEAKSLPGTYTVDLGSEPLSHPRLIPTLHAASVAGLVIAGLGHLYGVPEAQMPLPEASITCAHTGEFWGGMTISIPQKKTIIPSIQEIMPVPQDPFAAMDFAALAAAMEPVEVSVQRWVDGSLSSTIWDEVEE